MKKGRFDELEGLRGVAAVVVTIYHFLLAFYLYAFFGPSGNIPQHMRFEDNLYGNPFAVFLSGTFAVAIFFVLSGFVLSIGFFRSKDVNVIRRLAAKRYIRLMIPALVSTLLCFGIIVFGVAKIQEAGLITHSSWLLAQWSVDPSLFEAVKSGIYDVFMVSGSPYNNVLWTMAIEFAGSFLVFGYLAIFGKLRYRWVGYGVLLIVTFNTWFFAFIAGMIVADMYTKGYFAPKKRSFIVISSLLLVSLFLGGYPLNEAQGSVIYGLFSGISSSIDWMVVLLTLGAIGLMIAVLSSEQVARFFSNKWLSRLGKYTFALYLVHIPVIYTVGLVSFLLFYNEMNMSYHLSVLMCFAVVAPSIAIVTVVFERFVDAPSILISSKFARFVLGEEGIVLDKGKIKYQGQRFIKKFEVLWQNDMDRQRQRENLEK